MNECAALINTTSNIYKHHYPIIFMVWNKGKINKVIQICRVCGLEHEEWPSVKPNYCSRECYYKSREGIVGANKGKAMSKEQKEKISNTIKKLYTLGKIKKTSIKGMKIHSEEWKQKLREKFIKNNPVKNPEVLEKIRIANSGKRYSDETNKKKGSPQDKNPNWQGGKTKEWLKFRAHISSKLANWSREVKIRDNWTCQKCKSQDKKILQAHHIKQVKDYPELVLDLNNGITLCYFCHQEVHYV